MKFLKVGRVAIITRGRYAGKKVRNPTSTWPRLFDANGTMRKIDTKTNETWRGP